MQPLLRDGTVVTPSLIVIGDADTVIKPAATLQQAALFTDVTIAHHDGGHNVANRTTIAHMSEFLNRFVTAPTNDESV